MRAMVYCIITRARPPNSPFTNSPFRLVPETLTVAFAVSPCLIVKPDSLNLTPTPIYSFPILLTSAFSELATK